MTFKRLINFIITNIVKTIYTWNDIKIKEINAECVNAQGDEVIIKEEMFLCRECDVPEEIKKCLSLWCKNN